MAEKKPILVDSLESLQAKLADVRKAQQRYATYTQEQVDAIFRAAATYFMPMASSLCFQYTRFFAALQTVLDPAPRNGEMDAGSFSFS